MSLRSLSSMAGAVRPASPTKAPLKTLERYGVRARVDAELRKCGHVGHFIDLDLFLEDQGEWVTFGVVSDTIVQDAIILLQEAQEFVGEVNGVRLLPTVRLHG